MFNEIEWDKIEVSQQYMYEEKYYTQAEVTVLEDTSPYGDENYKSFKLKVDKAYTGCKDGEIFNAGKIIRGEGLYLVSGMKFKPIGSMFEYCTPGYNPWKIPNV
jgi:hypothetical protein